ncbi:MAG: amidohydrolase family protein [Alphaproteobacteria bacterium]|jgi:predicted TIM-barrel fold metal-dependent hydrolase|nr:amidohydrolase family protein [Alphaproteobacteria bacterium]
MTGPGSPRPGPGMAGGAIDIVVNPLTPRIVAARPDWTRSFHTDKIGRRAEDVASVSLEEMIAQMDAAGIGRAFLVACKLGQLGTPGAWHLPEDWIAEAVAAHPDRFSGLYGIDPTQGMDGVRGLERAVRDHGFIGAHFYPHWFELPPDHARWYPFYAKCCELDVPVQLQVGQSLVYYRDRPLRSVGRPITLDAVACDFPELKIVGIHIGIPWHDEMIAMAWKHDNVFIGSDAHAPKYWPPSFVHYLNSYGRSKVLFGTDYPVIAFDRAMREIADLGLKPETLEAFLHGNARRVYRLPA